MKLHDDTYYRDYLTRNAHVYGDLNDPRERDAMITQLRRRDALTLAAARRELWRKATGMSDARLRREITTYQYLTTSDTVRHRISPHLRQTDLWYLRMYRTELTRRGTPVR